MFPLIFCCNSANNAMQGLQANCDGILYRSRTDLTVGIAVASNGLTAQVSWSSKSFQQKEKTIIDKLNKLVYYNENNVPPAQLQKTPLSHHSPQLDV